MCVHSSHLRHCVVHSASYIITEWSNKYFISFVSPRIHLPWMLWVEWGLPAKPCLMAIDSIFCRNLKTLKFFVICFGLFNRPLLCPFSFWSYLFLTNLDSALDLEMFWIVPIWLLVCVCDLHISSLIAVIAFNKSGPLLCWSLTRDSWWWFYIRVFPMYMCVLACDYKMSTNKHWGWTEGSLIDVFCSRNKLTLPNWAQVPPTNVCNNIVYLNCFRM